MICTQCGFWQTYRWDVGSAWFGGPGASGGLEEGLHAPGLDYRPNNPHGHSNFTAPSLAWNKHLLADTRNNFFRANLPWDKHSNFSWPELSIPLIKERSLCSPCLEGMVSIVRERAMKHAGTLENFRRGVENILKC